MKTDDIHDRDMGAHSMFLALGFRMHRLLDIGIRARAEEEENRFLAVIVRCMSPVVGVGAPCGARARARTRRLGGRVRQYSESGVRAHIGSKKNARVTHGGPVDCPNRMSSALLAQSTFCRRIYDPARARSGRGRVEWRERYAVGKIKRWLRLRSTQPKMGKIVRLRREILSDDKYTLHSAR
jgi:hypothetical protein